MGETLADALVREIKEEMGCDAEISHYLGVVENGWQSGNVYNQEINHAFTVSIPEISAASIPPSAEEHLEFLWIKPEDFEQQNFRPLVIRPLISKWLEGDKEIWYETRLE